MNTANHEIALQELDDGVVLKCIDDLCFVHVADRPVDARQTRQLGEKLIAFIEDAGCRKLVMTFEGVEHIYSFLLEDLPLPRRALGRPVQRVRSGEHVPAGSDLWVG